MLQQYPGFQVIGEVSDGIEAVQKAQELKPDLVLLDIGLPKLNGIEAARRILDHIPHSKILFVSENRAWDVVGEALRTGAHGYVVKSDVAAELLPAINSVLQGNQFVSARFADHDPGKHSHDPIARRFRSSSIAMPLPPKNAEIGHHEITLYPDDELLVDGFARFIEAGLKVGYAVIVIVTNSHRGPLLHRLNTDGVDLKAALKAGRFVLADVAEALATLLVNDQPDRIRCAQVVGDLVAQVLQTANGTHPRVVVCGECAPTLLADGNAEGAIRLEQAWDQVTKLYNVDTLCGYSLSAFPSPERRSIVERICAEHSAVHARRTDN